MHREGKMPAGVEVVCSFSLVYERLDSKNMEGVP